MPEAELPEAELPETEMPETDAEASVCPPHRWFIEFSHTAAGGSELWTCRRCNDTRTVIRPRNLETRAWVSGKHSLPRIHPTNPEAAGGGA